MEESSKYVKRVLAGRKEGKKKRAKIGVRMNLLLHQLSLLVLFSSSASVGGLPLDEGGILDFTKDIGFTVEAVAVRMAAFRKDIEKETP
jgi:hypothetical protein